MSLQGGYYTLGKHGLDEQIIKKSRFIGQAMPVETEEEALAFIKSVKDQHKTASHNCFAYIIGANAGTMRYQDDGEPQGTAGIPILEVLKKNHLVNCAAVVTRYFGGVLLGAGGLTRAYSASAAATVKTAGIVTAETSLRLTAVIPYACWEKVNYHIEKMPVCEVAKEFTDQVTLNLIVREKDAAAIEKELTSLTDGIAAMDLSDLFYHQWAVSPQPEE